jgi:hypothetical protein
LVVASAFSRPVIAQQNHSGLAETVADDDAKRNPIDIDCGAAAGLLMAELQSLCTAERMAECGDTLEIESSSKSAGRIRLIQSFQLMQNKIDIGRPHRKEFFGQEARTGIAGEVEICSRDPLNDATIMQNNEEGSIWRVEPDNDVAMAGEVFGENGVLRRECGRASTHDHDRIGGLLGGDCGIGHAVDLNAIQITRKEIGHEQARTVRERGLPGARKVIRALVLSGKPRRVPDPGDDSFFLGRRW